MLPTNRQKREILRETGVRLPPGTFLDDLPLMIMPADEWKPRLQMLARKLTLALHYRYCGQPLSMSGGMLFGWYWNFDAHAGRLPEGLDELLEAMVPDPDASLPNAELDIGHARVSDAPIDMYAVSMFDQLLLLSWSTEDPRTFGTIDDVGDSLMRPFSALEHDALAA
jgi:hypothetical protein